MRGLRAEPSCLNEASGAWRWRWPTGRPALNQKLRRQTAFAPKRGHAKTDPQVTCLNMGRRRSEQRVRGVRLGARGTRVVVVVVVVVVVARRQREWAARGASCVRAGRGRAPRTLGQAARRQVSPGRRRAVAGAGGAAPARGCEQPGQRGASCGAVARAGGEAGRPPVGTDGAAAPPAPARGGCEQRRRRRAAATTEVAREVEPRRQH